MHWHKKFILPNNYGIIKGALAPFFILKKPYHFMNRVPLGRDFTALRGVWDEVKTFLAKI
jgi:hypothetical protein